MFRGSVYVPDATHGGWWRAESQLDLEIAGTPGVSGSRPNNLRNNSLSESSLQFRASDGHECGIRTSYPDDVSCLLRNIANRAKI
jgi:hypothetical protein